MVYILTISYTNLIKKWSPQRDSFQTITNIPTTTNEYISNTDNISGKYYTPEVKNLIVLLKKHKEAIIYLVSKKKKKCN